MTDRLASRGAIGGSANERGSEFRGLIGAGLAQAILSGARLCDVGVSGLLMRPTLLAVESDDDVDDLVVTDDAGARVFFQAKLEAGLGQDRRAPMGKAVSQFAAAIRTGLGPDDRLVLATARPTEDVRRLADVLERERRPAHGARSGPESRAAEAFARLARRFLDQGGVDELFRRLVIWRVDPTSYATAIAARLEVSVTANGAGETGKRALVDAIQELAGLRAGTDARSLVAELLRRDVPLSDSVDPAIPAARARALARFRASLRARGERLELYGIAGELGALPLSEADCDVKVVEDGDTRGIGEELEAVIRRRGRALLIGEPGGGKSTALRALAALAARNAAWPTPISAHVGPLLTAEGGLTDRLLELAVADTASPERGVRHRALADEISAGEALVILDGFDELRARRWASAARRLRTWFDSLPASIEVVLAVRPVASGADAAGGLGLRPYRLQAPDQAWNTVDTILRAIDPTDSADALAAGDADSAWVGERKDWTSSAFARDPILESRPLMVVIITVLAAGATDLAQLPRTRARILLRVLDETPSRWEFDQREGELTIGRLEGGEAELAIAQTLDHLCALAVTAPETIRSALRAQISEMFAEGFGLPSGSAASAAEDAVSFWVRAGMFAVEDDQVIVRVRPLAEAGLAAQWVAADHAEIPNLVADARADRGLWETLALAAGLSREVIDAWATAASEDGDSDEIVALVDASREGERPGADATAALLHRAPALLADPDDAERVGEALALLALTPAQRELLRAQVLNAVRPERQLMMRAFLICIWQERTADDEHVLRDFVAWPWPVKKREHSDDDEVWVIDDDSVDSTYQHAYEQAVLRIVPLSRSDADLAVTNYHAGSVTVGHELRSLLARSGHDDLADRIAARWQTGFGSSLKDDPPTTPQFLRWISELAPARVLTFDERRHLQELADLLESASLNYVFPNMLGRHPQGYPRWIGAVAVLGGFDLSLLSAEAGSLSRELTNEDTSEFFIYKDGRERRTDKWDRVDDVTAMLDNLAESLGILPQPASQQLMYAFASCPDHEQAAARVMEALPQLRIWGATLAARIILVCLAAISEERATEQASKWLNHEDPMVRLAAASWFSISLQLGSANDQEWRRSLEDSDWSVRRAALSALEDVTLNSDQIRRLEALASEPAGHYTCSRCGTVNKSTLACTDCHSQAPMIRQRVKEILHPAKNKEPFGLSRLELPVQRRHVRREPRG